VLFDSANAAIKIMDLAVGSVKDEYPDFYNGYRNSRKIIETSSGTLALTASAKDIANGEPVQGALFTFRPLFGNGASGNGNGEITKKTALKGNFNIKCISAGNYNVSVSKSGYMAKEVSVNVVAGERNVLVVELEKA
jgi:hypothetical protein